MNSSRSSRRRTGSTARGPEAARRPSLGWAQLRPPQLFVQHDRRLLHARRRTRSTVGAGAGRGPLLVLGVEHVPDRPRRWAEPGTAGPGQSPGPGAPGAGRLRPQRGVELGHHRVERPRKGEWYKLYVVLDIFSRYVPGWLVAHAEDAVVAKDFLAGAVARNLVIPHTIHADRGGSMTSKPVSEMMIDLGILRSHSRPRTSNDNPYSPGTVQDPSNTFPTSRTGSDHSPTHARSATGFSPPTTTSTATPGSACTPRPQSTTEPPPTSAHDARPPSTVPTHSTPSGSAADLSHRACPSRRRSTNPPSYRGFASDRRGGGWVGR